LIWRGYCEYTYTQCMRCERKVPISDCNWCDGLLVCHTYACYDRVINGSFELRVAREASRDRQELVPDPVLVDPIDPIMQLENVSASAGTW
jgi:hypothetical protein